LSNLLAGAKETLISKSGNGYKQFTEKLNKAKIDSMGLPMRKARILAATIDMFVILIGWTMVFLLLGILAAGIGCIPGLNFFFGEILAFGLILAIPFISLGASTHLLLRDVPKDGCLGLFLNILLPGKRLQKIEVVSKNNEPISLILSLKRNFPLVVFFLCGPFFLILCIVPLFNAIFIPLTTALYPLQAVLYVVETCLVFFSPNGKRIGDYLAGTEHCFFTVDVKRTSTKNS